MVLNLFGKLPFSMNFKTKLPPNSFLKNHASFHFLHWSDNFSIIFCINICYKICYFMKFKEFANFFLRSPQVKKHCCNTYSSSTQIRFLEWNFGSMRRLKCSSNSYPFCTRALSYYHVIHFKYILSGGGGRGGGGGGLTPSHYPPFAII